jgi:hypothetical protein
MEKLLLLSDVLMAVYLPIRAARTSNPWLGLRRAVWWVAFYNAFYLFALLYIYPRITS